ncbi:MAG: fucA 2 [Chloroflexi bacterium]|nr:fucA 2 [Chloroflexota bacterium]
MLGSPIPVSGGTSLQDIEARAQIVLGCRILSHRRLVEGFGHISVRLDDGTVLVTPRKALLLVDADEIIRLTTDGQIVGGTGAAPVETNMHLAVYRRRSDVQAIARTHSFTTSAFAAMGRPIRAVHNFGTHLGQEVPIYPDIALIASPERAEAVADTLGSRDAVLLRGNGTLVTAPTLTEAVMRAIWLEESATLQATILAAGGQPTYFTAEEVALRRVMDMPHEPVRAWDYEVATLAPTQYFPLPPTQ